MFPFCPTKIYIDHLAFLTPQPFNFILISLASGQVAITKLLIPNYFVIQPLRFLKAKLYLLHEVMN